MPWEQKDWVTLGVTVVLGGIGIWYARRQLHVAQRQEQAAADAPRSSAKLQAARRLSEAVLKVRDEMQHCRAPLITVAEHNSPMNTHAERERGFRQVYSKRWEPVRLALDELEAAAREAEAMFGPEVRTKVAALQQCARNLYAAIDAYLDNEAANGEHFKSDREFGKKMRALVSASSKDATNELNQEVSRAVADIDAMLAPHLR